MNKSKHFTSHKPLIINNGGVINRQSNIELLRIVAMSMILIHHFIVHVLYPDTTARMPGSFFFYYPFFICGVNLFFMISGYFGIKLSIKGILKIAMLLIVFRLANGGLMLLTGNPVPSNYLFKTFLLPLSKEYYWFIAVYLGLMITAPFLNKALQEMPLPKLRGAILLFTLFTIYSCWFGRNECNSSGYTYGQAIYIYCLARYIRRDDALRNKFKRATWLYLYIAILATSGVAFFFSGKFSTCGYNSPFTITASVCLFIFFTHLDFKNNIVNHLSAAALGCYLLQDGMFGNEFFYGWMRAHSPISVLILILTACFLLLWAVSYPLTLIANRISSAIAHRLPEKIAAFPESIQIRK